MKLWREFIEIIEVKMCCEIFGRYFIYLVIGISATKCGSISLTCPSTYVNMLDSHHTYTWEGFTVSLPVHLRMTIVGNGMEKDSMSCFVIEALSADIPTLL